ncbi:hypothetical protein AB0D45_17125 [Streptomyces sp. NPDC048352]|uniref:hypothetical protein n=1 Tax=Streptomyces sp. NPDC048352 TaxID=3154718 RepID=UPI003434E4A8
MSTPPNPPEPPSGPPTEAAGTPIPETAKPSPSEPPQAPEPEPAKPSLLKSPGAQAPTPPEPQPAGPSPAKLPAPAPEDARPSLAKTLPSAPEGAIPASGATPHADVPPVAPPQAGVPPLTPPPAPAPAPLTPTPPAEEYNPFATPAPGAAPPQFAPISAAPPAAAWSQPGQPAAPYGGYPGYPAYPGFHPAPAAPSNGMAVAALVLGLVAVPVALVPFVFWIGALLGLTALGLGIAAFVRARAGAPRKAMAVVGAVLGVLGLGACVGGWFTTVTVIDRAIDRSAHGPAGGEWDDDYDDEDPDADTPYPTPSTGPGMSTPLAFGRTYTYPNGIELTIGQPRAYTTSSKWIEVGNAVEVPFTITNTSDEPHRVVHAIPEVRDDQGKAGKLVFDGRMPKRVDTVIEPGHSASGSAAFEVPVGTRSISAELSPGVLLPPAKFSGPIG